MASFVSAQNCFIKKTKEEEEQIQTTFARFREIISTLPKQRGWFGDLRLCHYHGFLFSETHGMEGVMWVQHHFRPNPTDLLLISSPKSGTTWLKALIFSITNRTRFDYSTHPLLTNNPHDCVPFLELNLFLTPPIGDPEVLPSPRALSSHIPYALLPESVLDCGCRIVYVCRNPKDVFVSFWHFEKKLAEKLGMPLVSLEEAFDLFCQGISNFGPFWDHAMGYWKASLESPDKILFLKYDDMRKQPMEYVKKLAEFFGHPFCSEEEESGVVQAIVELCSFEKLESVVVNQDGKNSAFPEMKNDVFFREGKVGDWNNHLTRQMVERLDQIMEDKFGGTNLVF